MQSFEALRCGFDPDSAQKLCCLDVSSSFVQAHSQHLRSTCCVSGDVKIKVQIIIISVRDLGRQSGKIWITDEMWGVRKKGL